MEWERPKPGNVGWGWIAVGWIISVALAVISVATQSVQMRRRPRRYVPADVFPDQPILSRLEEVVSETLAPETSGRIPSRTRTGR